MESAASTIESEQAVTQQHPVSLQLNILGKFHHLSCTLFNEINLNLNYCEYNSDPAGCIDRECYSQIFYCFSLHFCSRSVIFFQFCLTDFSNGHGAMVMSNELFE